MVCLYVGAKGLVAILNDRVIPVHIPPEQIRTLQPDNPDPYHCYHAAHLNVGFLYAALDLQSTSEASECLKPQGLERCSALALAAIGKEVLHELVQDKYGPWPAEETRDLCTSERHLEGVGVMQMCVNQVLDPKCIHA